MFVFIYFFNIESSRFGSEPDQTGKGLCLLISKIVLNTLFKSFNILHVAIFLLYNLYEYTYTYAYVLI